MKKAHIFNPENPFDLVFERGFFEVKTEKAAKALLGTILLKKSEGLWTGGRIVETEAYLGENDDASHAARKKTPRNSVMFGPVGCSYVYLIYGMYNCFNVVAFDPQKERAGAVLIRALEPLYGIELMQERRRKSKLKGLTDGPGKLCMALDITREDNGLHLNEGGLILIKGGRIPAKSIGKSGRIGINSAQEKQLRFFVKDNPFVSR